MGAYLFQSCILLLSCRLHYFSLHDDYPPFLQFVHYKICLHSSTTIFEKLKAVKQIYYTDHGPQSCSGKFQFSCCLLPAKYCLFESHKVFERDLLN